jgi:hypothetical protein
LAIRYQSNNRNRASLQLLHWGRLLLQVVLLQQLAQQAPSQLQDQRQEPLQELLLRQLVQGQLPQELQLPQMLQRVLEFCRQLPLAALPSCHHQLLELLQKKTKLLQLVKKMTKLLQLVQRTLMPMQLPFPNQHHRGGKKLRGALGSSDNTCLHICIAA